MKPSPRGIRAMIPGVDFRRSDVYGSDSEIMNLSTNTFRRHHNSEI